MPISHEALCEQLASPLKISCTVTLIMLSSLKQRGVHLHHTLSGYAHECLNRSPLRHRGAFCDPMSVIRASGHISCW